MNTKRRTRLGLLSLPLVFAVQGAEEVWAMPGWAARHAGEIPAFVSSFMPQDQTELLAALAVLAVPFLVAPGLALPAVADDSAPRGRDRPAVLLLAALAAGLGTNALGHLGQAMLMGGYVPGLVTGLALCVPYAVWALWALGRRGLLGRRAAAWCVVGSAVLQVPLLIGVVAAVRRVAG